MSHITRQSDTSLSPATSSSSHLRPEKRPSEDDPHAHDATAKVAKRAQVSRACQRCRNLRRACSDYRPCKRCSDHGLADQCLGMPGPVQITWGPGHIAGAGAAAATSPQAYVLPPAQDSVQRLAHLLPVTVVNYCARRFFARLYPTIPIVTADYIGRLKAAAASSTPSEVAMEAQLVLAAMSALILLQVEEPESLFNEGLISEKNSAYGERLFDEAILAHRNFARKSNPSLELCLLTFLLYACHAALLHHSQAFLFLREANTLFTFHYPLEVAKDLTLSTRDLPLDSIKVHGVGLTEKLFDIASSVVDVLARIPIAPSSPSGLGIGIGSEDDLNYIRRLITQLPGGPDIYDALLDKHIQQAVPDMELGRVQNLAD
ncbi:DNA replication licensing factor mcm7 [Verticillium dahliae VDG1]|nr:DNA replication licensing factor mcm7 [Verticillium dahliae VDG1]